MSFYTKAAIMDAVGNGDIVITPFNKNNIGPNSYDLTLSLFYKVYEHKTLETGVVNECREFIMHPNGLVLDPSVVYLFQTEEHIITRNCVGSIHARSSASRLGIDMVTSGGLGDVGYEGHWTLCVSVRQPVKIYPFDKLCQIVFHTTHGACDENYGNRKTSKYQNELGTQGPLQYRCDSDN